MSSGVPYSRPHPVPPRTGPPQFPVHGFLHHKFMEMIISAKVMIGRMTTHRPTPPTKNCRIEESPFPRETYDHPIDCECSLAHCGSLPVGEANEHGLEVVAPRWAFARVEPCNWFAETPQSGRGLDQRSGLWVTGKATCSVFAEVGHFA